MSYSCQSCPAVLGRSLGVFVKPATAILAGAEVGAEATAFLGTLAGEAPKKFCGWDTAGLAVAITGGFG